MHELMVAHRRHTNLHADCCVTEDPPEQREHSASEVPCMHGGQTQHIDRSAERREDLCVGPKSHAIDCPLVDIAGPVYAGRLGMQ